MLLIVGNLNDNEDSKSTPKLCPQCGQYVFINTNSSYSKGLTESTVEGWFKQAMEHLMPLYEVLKSEVIKADYIQADEVTTPVMKIRNKSSVS